jgi:glycolate oxidase FAD binding subunit
MPPTLDDLQQRVRQAAAAHSPLYIEGCGSKKWLGGTIQGEVLALREHAGITAYEPTELVITARCGTPLAEVEAVLAREGQCLPFEPPGSGEASVGGMVAAGLSGPARASVGALRDYVLGASLINGRGELLHFGGQVMKNVAGFDVARLLCGSLGTLGVITEVSLKVLPVAPAEASLRFDCGEAEAIRRLNAWAAQPLPLNASLWHAGELCVRLRGAKAAVQAACAALGGQRIDEGEAAALWQAMRERTHAFFEGGQALWRLSLPPTAAPLGLGDTLIEWHGAQRWLRGSGSAEEGARLRAAAAQAGGHATLFRGGDKSQGVFAPLAPPLDRIHRALKQAFDPAGIFNRGRLYPDF